MRLASGSWTVLFDGHIWPRGGRVFWKRSVATNDRCPPLGIIEGSIDTFLGPDLWVSPLFIKPNQFSVRPTKGGHAGHATVYLPPASAGPNLRTFGTPQSAALGSDGSRETLDVPEAFRLIEVARFHSSTTGGKPPGGGGTRRNGLGVKQLSWIYN